MSEAVFEIGVCVFAGIVYFLLVQMDFIELAVIIMLA